MAHLIEAGDHFVVVSGPTQDRITPFGETLEVEDEEFNGLLFKCLAVSDGPPALLAAECVWSPKSGHIKKRLIFEEGRYVLQLVEEPFVKAMLEGFVAPTGKSMFESQYGDLSWIVPPPKGF